MWIWTDILRIVFVVGLRNFCKKKENKYWVLVLVEKGDLQQMYEVTTIKLSLIRRVEDITALSCIFYY